MRRLFLLFLLCIPILSSAQVSPIQLYVDATSAPQKFLRAHLLIPVKPGPLTLYYPKWVPGLHEPTGPVANLTGLKFQAGGKVVAWDRGLRDVFTFHVDVPPGANEIEASFDYLEPSGAGGGPAAGMATSKLMVLNWNQAVLYPAGTPAAQLIFKPTLLLPAGWKFGTALGVEKDSGGMIDFRPVA